MKWSQILALTILFIFASFNVDSDHPNVNQIWMISIQVETVFDGKLTYVRFKNEDIMSLSFVS